MIGVLFCIRFFAFFFAFFLAAEAAPPGADDQGHPITPPAPVDFNAEAAMLLSTLVLIAGPFFPSVPKVWTKDKQAAVAAAAAPVMVKYGFTLGDFMGAYKEEIALLLVAGPVILETIDGIKADRAAGKAPEGAAEPDPMPPPAEGFKPGTVRNI